MLVKDAIRDSKNFTISWKVVLKEMCETPVLVPTEAVSLVEVTLMKM